MNLFALSGILGFFTNIFLGVFVLIRTPYNYTNRLWAYFTFSVAIWEFFAYKMAISTTPLEALTYSKLSQIGVILLPPLFLHFLCSFLKIKRNKIIFLSYIIATCFLSLLLFNLLTNEITFLFNSFYYPKFSFKSIYMLFFLSWLTIFLYGYLILYSQCQESKSIQKEELKYFFLGTTVGFLGGATCFLPGFGLNIYPYGNFFVAVFPVIMTIVILKYKLLNIHVVIKKSIVYSLLITIISLTYLITVLVFERILQKSLGYNSILPTISITFIIGLLFVPLRTHIQFIVDKHFFKGSPNDLFEQNKHLRLEIEQTDKLRMTATLVSGIAHEIRNPLTSIRTFNEHLLKKKNEPGFIEKYQCIVEKETDRINNLISELLIFAKPSEPKFELINPNQIIQELITLVESKCLSVTIAIEQHLNNTIEIQADPNLLKQALLNIILNAIDAMPNGGTLTITSENNKINKQLQISISDTGHGIDSKDLPHIFEPFYSKKEKGTGLGLSITQGIVEKHGGKLSVHTKLREGTTFKITLKF